MADKLKEVKAKYPKRSKLMGYIGVGVENDGPFVGSGDEYIRTKLEIGKLTRISPSP